MGKMIVHEFNPNIYTRPLLVCLNATIDGLNKMFDFIPNNEGLEKAISGNAASVSSVVRKSDGKYAALVFSKNKRGIYGSTIAHEAVHVADYYFESLGMLSQTFLIVQSGEYYIMTDSGKTFEKL